MMHTRIRKRANDNGHVVTIVDSSTVYDHPRALDISLSDDGGGRAESALSVTTPPSNQILWLTRFGSRDAGNPIIPTTKKVSIQTTHSCLLIPVFIGVWWYWTKRKARRVFRRLRLMTPIVGCNDDNDFSTNTNNENGMDQNSTYPDFEQEQDGDLFQTGHEMGVAAEPNTTTRWVRWLKGGSQSARAKRKIHISTMDNLRRESSILTKNRKNQQLLRHPLSEEPKQQDQSIDSSLMGDVEWKCIQDTMGYELCTMSQVPSFSSDDDAFIKRRL